MTRTISKRPISRNHSYASQTVSERSRSKWNHFVRARNRLRGGSGSTPFISQTMSERSRSSWNHFASATNDMGTVEFMLEPLRSRHKRCQHGRFRAETSLHTLRTMSRHFLAPCKPETETDSERQQVRIATGSIFGCSYIPSCLNGVTCWTTQVLYLMFNRAT